jgi:hypothetical protein
MSNEIVTKEKLWEQIDELEFEMSKHDLISFPLVHSFIPGFYCRTVYLPAETLVTSEVHKTTHLFHLLVGTVHVKNNEAEWVTIIGRYSGLTEAGTRRVVYVETDSVWTTFHQIEDSEQPEGNSTEEIEAAVKAISSRIIEPHVNKLLGGTLKNSVLYKNISAVK